MIKNLDESVKYEIDVTSVDPHDVTNQRYFTGKGISSNPKDAKLYDSEEAAKADFKKVPKKFNGALIRDVRVAKRFVKESKKVTENIDTWESDVDEILEKIDALEVPLEADAYKYTLKKLLAIRFKINKTIKEFQELSVGESKKLVKESKLREFDQGDWNTFAGAERFTDGSEPLIAEFADGSITLIVSGISDDYDEDNEAIVQLSYLNEENDEEGGYYKDFESKDDAMKFALEISTELDYYTPEEATYDDMSNFADSHSMSELF